MALNLANAIVNFLEQNPEQKYTARGIAKWILETYPDECRQKQERSSTIGSDKELLQQIVAENDTSPRAAER